MHTLIEQTTRSFWMFVGSLFLLVGTIIWSFYGMGDNRPDSVLFTGEFDTRSEHTGDTDDIGDTLADQVVLESNTYREIIQKNINKLYTDINQKNVSTVSGYFDGYMKKSDLVRQYFTPEKLTTLVDNLSGGIQVVRIDELPLLRSERVRASYMLRYMLRDGQLFEETWEVTMRPE